MTVIYYVFNKICLEPGPPMTRALGAPGHDEPKTD